MYFLPSGEFNEDMKTINGTPCYIYTFQSDGFITEAIIIIENGYLHLLQMKEIGDEISQEYSQTIEDIVSSMVFPDW